MELAPAYLIAGSDWPKVDAALRRLRARFEDEAVEQLSTVDGDADVVAACNALGLFGGRRLVLVRGAEALDAAAVEAIGDYLRAPAPDTTLALFGGPGIERDGPLAKAVGTVGEVRLFDVAEGRDASSWVGRRFAELGTPCPGPVARRLVELVGDDPGELALEVEKIATACGGEEPALEDLERLVVADPDLKPWNLTDAWGRRDAAAVLRLAELELERPADVQRLVGSLLAHVRKVRRALLVLEEGGSHADVAKAVGAKPFAARKLVDQSRRFTEAELAAAIMRLAEVDVAAKGGSRLDPRFELELALADITTS